MTKILIAVTGGIAAYKVPSIVSALINDGHEVKVMMTKTAEKFVTPLSLATMSKNRVYTEDFFYAADGHVYHIELADWANIIAVIPATYNTFSKITQKIADNMVTSTIAAIPPNKKILIFPAMNMHMWNNLELPVFEKFNKYTKGNMTIFKPASGKQACGTVGIGKLLSTKEIIDIIYINLEGNSDVT